MDIDGADAFELDGRVPDPPVPVEVALDPDAHVVVRRGGRGRLAIGALVAVVLVAAGVAVLARSGEDADAAEALREAQELVAATEAYRFEQLAEMHSSTGDPDGAGSDTTTRTLQTGTVEAPDRWHVVHDFGDEFAMETDDLETVRLGDQMYATGLMEPGSEGPKWVVTTIPDDLPTAADLADLHGADFGFDDDDPYADEARLDLAMAALLTDPAGDPTAVTRVITEATDPVMEEERGDGGVVLRAQLPPTPELAELGDIPTVDVFLHLDADRQPVEARFTAEVGAASAEVTVSFSDWGGSIAVEPPADAEVDHTPWISEEGLAVLDPKLLLAPTSLPEPLEIVGASVFDTEFDEGLSEGEAAPCPQLSLTMGSESEALLSSDEADMTEEELEEHYSSMTFLDLSIVDPACSDMYDTGYFDGELAGFPASGDQGMWEVAIGDVVVSIYSEGYDEEEVAAVIASMQPTTVDALAAAIPGWVADGMEGAFGSGGFALGGWSGMGFAFG